MAPPLASAMIHVHVCPRPISVVVASTAAGKVGLWMQDIPAPRLARNKDERRF